MTSLPQSRDQLEDRRGQNNEMSREMQETMETEAGKTRTVEAEGRGKERRSRKIKKTEERKDDRHKKSS